MRRTIALACTVSMAAAGCAKKEPAPPNAPPARTAPASAAADTPPRSRGAGGLVSGPGTAFPRKTKHVQPIYPQAARQARIQGAVRLRATISEQGRVVDITVLDGPVELREAAITAVEQWEFKPGSMKGVPVATATELVVDFKMD